MLDIREINAGYGPSNVLHGLSLTIERGHLTAIFGPNGGGKSTLAKALAGLLPITSGKVVFEGEDVTKLQAERLARNGLLLVPQEGNIFANLSVEENLRLGAGLSRKTPAGAGIEKAFTMFPILKQRRQQTAGTLSGGERQMLAIGSAIIADPKLLILDEPTSGLAPVIVHQLIEQAVKYARSGATVVWMIGDSVDAILPYGDKAVLVHGGQCVGQWTAADMPSGDHLADLYMGNLH